jgi:2-polyprenyl-3-methyl-5-hydroxy-6-metoxy-1,4-benzoquinol methylase
MKRNAIWDYDEEMTFINEIKKCENMALDIDSSYHFAFSISDALMTDAGSFLLEYLPTEKPILYLHHPKGYGLNDEIEIIKDNYYIAKNSEDIIHYFDMISKNNDPKKQKRINIINEALFSTDGKSGERILDHIKRSLYQEKSNGFPVELQNSISHQKSYKYWVENECTYLAPKDFYDKQETALRKFMRSIKRVDHALDIGCGDGKFTFIVSAKAKSTIAFDVSAKLIAKAKENAKEMNIKNVTFFADSIENAMNLGSYDLISCMGVTSCIIDDSCLIRFLDRLKQMAKPNSYLILKDTLSLDYNKIISDQNYIAKYRNIDDYLSAFFNRNFKLLKEQTLAINKEKNFVNRLLLLRQMGDVT